ncbi:hypothetical protein IWX90DRAFT_237674 [Phyllosticta citrichinensis]|uniref:PA14 domain-containing protein n=1 Tax=Phyllosticta citrichinensis TaxID=1130410 RepID=A0ABR1XPV5_9PEZI
MENWLRRKLSRESVNTEVDAPAEKRLRTPAGLRLSKIVDSPERDDPLIRPPSSTNINDRSSTDITPAPNTQSCRTTFTAGSVLKVELKIEASGEDCAEKRRIYRRRCLVVSIKIAAIIALVVGLSVGLKKKSSDEKSPSDSRDTVSVGGANSNAPMIPGSTNATNATSASNDKFPAGSYTFTTFLDSVQRGCTSVRDTWSCYPYKSYDEDPVRSMTTFNWVISPSSEGVYQISSAANSALIVFSNADLKLIDEGQDSERYEFRLVVDKRVSPSIDLTDDASKAVCFYNKTTFVASLFTKQPKSYPATSNTTSNGISPLEAAWPFAVRVEQHIAAGNDVPDCEPKGHISERFTKGLIGLSSTGSCSCLYRNFFDAG